MPNYHATMKDFGDSMIFTQGRYYEKIIDEKPVYKKFSGENIGFERSNVKELCASKKIESAIFAVLKNYINEVGDCTPMGFDIPVYVYKINKKPDIDISDTAKGDFALIEEVRYRNLESNPINSQKCLEIQIPDNVLLDIELCYLYSNGGIDNVINEWGEEVKKAIKYYIKNNQYPKNILKSNEQFKSKIKQYI